MINVKNYSWWTVKNIQPSNHPIRSPHVTLACRAGIRSDAWEKVGRVWVQGIAQVRFNELYILQTTSEPGGRWQAVLLYPNCEKEMQRWRMSKVTVCRWTRNMNAHRGSLPDKLGFLSQLRWIVGKGLGWCSSARPLSNSGYVWFFWPGHGAIVHHTTSDQLSALSLSPRHYSR